jgi:hypothetical protein
MLHLFLVVNDEPMSVEPDRSPYGNGLLSENRFMHMLGRNPSLRAGETIALRRLDRIGLNRPRALECDQSWAGGSSHAARVSADHRGSKLIDYCRAGVDV